MRAAFLSLAPRLTIARILARSALGTRMVAFLPIFGFAVFGDGSTISPRSSGRATSVACCAGTLAGPGWGASSSAATTSAVFWAAGSGAASGSSGTFSSAGSGSAISSSTFLTGSAAACSVGRVSRAASLARRPALFSGHSPLTTRSSVQDWPEGVFCMEPPASKLSSYLGVSTTIRPMPACLTSTGNFWWMVGIPRFGSATRTNLPLSTCWMRKSTSSRVQGLGRNLSVLAIGITSLINRLEWDIAFIGDGARAIGRTAGLSAAGFRLAPRAEEAHGGGGHLKGSLRAAVLGGPDARPAGLLVRGQPAFDQHLRTLLQVLVADLGLLAPGGDAEPDRLLDDFA